MNKPREFALAPALQMYADLDGEYNIKSTDIHVIEYSAYEKLEFENKTLHEIRVAQFNIIQSLNERLARYEGYKKPTT